MSRLAEGNEAGCSGQGILGGGNVGQCFERVEGFLKQLRVYNPAKGHVDAAVVPTALSAFQQGD